MNAAHSEVKLCSVVRVNAALDRVGSLTGSIPRPGSAFMRKHLQLLGQGLGDL